VQRERKGEKEKSKREMKRTLLPRLDTLLSSEPKHSLCLDLGADVVDTDGRTVSGDVLGLEGGKLVIGHGTDVKATVDVEHRGKVGEGDGLGKVDGGKDEVCNEGSGLEATLREWEKARKTGRTKVWTKECKRTELESVRLGEVLLGGEDNVLRTHLLRILNLVLLVGNHSNLRTKSDSKEDGKVTETTYRGRESQEQNENGCKENEPSPAMATFVPCFTP
jgi:hypothetical protein